METRKKKTWYDVLGVNSNASAELIEAAYLDRKNELKDKADPDSVNELKLVREAFLTLSAPEKRTAYDQHVLSTTSSRTIYYSDGMVDEGIQDEGPSLVKIAILSASLIAGLAIALNYSTNRKIIESSQHSTDKQLDNQHEFQNGIIENQSKAIDNQRVYLNNTSNTSNRLADIEQQRAINQSVALAEARAQAEKMENQRKEMALRQQEAEEERKRQQSSEIERQRLMSQMISMKEWDTARGLAKTPYELSMINQQEQANSRNSVQTLNDSTTYTINVTRSASRLRRY